MSRKMTYFLYALVFVLGAANYIEALWLIIILYALKSLNQKMQERVIVAGGAASLGAVMKSFQTMAATLETADLVHPIKSVIDFIAYNYAYEYMMIALSVVFLIIGVIFVIIACISKN